MLGTPPQSPRQGSQALEQELPNNGCLSAPGGVDQTRSDAVLGDCLWKLKLRPEEYSIADDSDGGNNDQLYNQAALAGSPNAAEAREARLAIVGAAEARVKVRTVETHAAIAIQRHREEQETQRCRIIEDARTQRVERLAGLAEVVVHEKHRTQRERDARRTELLRQAIAVNGQLQRLKVKSQASSLSTWMLASLVGAVGASAGGGGRPPAGRVPGRVRSKAAGTPGASRYVSALLLVAFVRHLWLNPEARKQLTSVWSSEFGPLRSSGSRLLRGALGVLLQVVEGGWGSAAGTAPARKRKLELAPPPTIPKMVSPLMLGPDASPDGWVCKEGPCGRKFWHHTSLGPAPWDISASLETTTRRQSGGEGSTCADNDRGSHQSAAEKERPTPGSPPPAPAAALPMPSRGSLGVLANWGLHSYSGPLASNGYDAEILKAMSPGEIEEMLQVIECRPEDERKFRRFLESWR